MLTDDYLQKICYARDKANNQNLTGSRALPNAVAEVFKEIKEIERWERDRTSRIARSPLPPPLKYINSLETILGPSVQGAISKNDSESIMGAQHNSTAWTDIRKSSNASVLICEIAIRRLHKALTGSACSCV